MSEAALAALVSAIAIPDMASNWYNRKRDTAIGEALLLLDPGHVVYRVSHTGHHIPDREQTTRWVETWCVYIGDERFDWVKHCDNQGGDAETPRGYFSGHWGDPGTKISYKVEEHDGVLRPVDVRRRINALKDERLLVWGRLNEIQAELQTLQGW